MSTYFEPPNLGNACALLMMVNYYQCKGYSFEITPTDTKENVERNNINFITMHQHFRNFGISV